MSTVDTLRSMIVDAFAVKPEALLPTTRLQDFDVDSLSWLEFSFVVEQRFKIDLHQDLVRADLTLQAFADAIDEIASGKDAVAVTVQNE